MAVVYNPEKFAWFIEGTDREVLPLSLMTPEKADLARQLISALERLRDLKRAFRAADDQEYASRIGSDWPAPDWYSPSLENTDSLERFLAGDGSAEGYSIEPYMRQVNG